MSMNDTEAMLRNICVDNETALEHVMKLEGMEWTDAEGVRVYSGKHPIHGNIHIVIPAMGNGMLLLPFALRAF